MIALAALFQSKTGGRMLLRGTLRVVSVLVLMAVSGFAQSDRGAIRGTISDTSGAVIPESKVTALNLATGVTSSTVSTGAGVYDIPSLTAGTYRVQVEHAGFKTLVREHVDVRVS